MQTFETWGRDCFVKTKSTVAKLHHLRKLGGQVAICHRRRLQPSEMATATSVGHQTVQIDSPPLQELESTVKNNKPRVIKSQNQSKVSTASETFPPPANAKTEPLITTKHINQLYSTSWIVSWLQFQLIISN